MAGFVGSSSTQTLGTGAGTGGTTLTVTKTGCTAGNLLVVCFALWQSTNTDPGAVSASGWTGGPQQVEAASSHTRVGWLFLPNCGSGSQSAVLTWANASDCTAIIHEYSGMGAATLDGTAGSSGSTSPFSTGNATSTGTGELAVGVIGDDGSNTTYTQNDGKNDRGGQNPSATVPALDCTDLLSTTSTTNSAGWTSNQSPPGDAAFCVGVLKPGLAVAPQRGAGPRFTPNTRRGQRPLTAAPVVVTEVVQNSPFTPLPAARGPRFRPQTTGQVPLGGLPAPISGADDTAVAADSAFATNLYTAVLPQLQRGPQFRPWITGQEPLGGLPAPVSAADTAAGADGVAQIGLTGADDAAVGTDSATSTDLYTAVVSQRLNTGPRFHPWTEAQVPLGPLIAVPVQVSASDTATGADAVTQIALGTAGEISDGSAGADAITSIGLTGVDVGAGADGVTLVGLTGADAGTGADGVGTVGLNTTDAGTATDGASVLVLAAGISVILAQGQRGPRFPLAIEPQSPLGLPPPVGALRDVDMRVYGVTSRWAIGGVTSRWSTRSPQARWATGILSSRWRTSTPTARWAQKPPEAQET